MRHKEIAFIPLNDGDGHRPPKPWFAISALHWSAAAARDEMTAAFVNEDKKECWKRMRKEGWRIVKVRVSQISDGR